MDLRFDDQGAPYGRLRSRVSGTPAIGSSFPTQVLWEEIETPGEGQIRGLLTVAGNPVLSNANAGRVMAALHTLEFMVSVGVVEDNFGALMSATREAAVMNRIDHLVGTLEVGKEADVIVVDGDPVADLGALARVQMTLVGGCLMFSR